MNKTIYSRQSRSLHEMLVQMRKKSGLTQRQLANKIDREHSLIARLELGERRLDVVEFYLICKACGTNPGSEAARLMSEFEKIASKDKKEQ